MKNPTIETITVSLIETMLHLLEVLPAWSGLSPNFSQPFTRDLQQFIAINVQLHMLLCTEPIHSWALNDWRQNFLSLLTQTLRLYHHCLQKIIVNLNHNPVYSKNLIPIWTELFPLVSEAKRYLK